MPARVGSVRPTQLLSTFGVGATVDLPQISAMIMGLNDWPITDMQIVTEERLLRLVRVLHPTVRSLRGAPLPETTGFHFERDSIPRGVPVAGFPRWLVCTSCRLLAPIASGLFEFRGDSFHPERSRFVHGNCPRLTNAVAIPARFLVACPDGHIDDFPWNTFLHGEGIDCDGPLELREIGPGGEASDTWLKCRACNKQRSMAQAFSQDGRASLAACRGWYPHLRVAPAAACNAEARPIVLGATNQWFSQVYSALSIPSTADPLEQLVERDLTSLFDGVESAREAGFARRGQAKYERYSDQQIWDALQKIRNADPTAAVKPQELKIPEWRLFSRPDPTRNSRDLQLRPVDPPARYARWIQRVVLVEKLREVRALVGFTRIESSGEDTLAHLAPLHRGGVDWVPAAQVRGEGLFLQLSESEVDAWVNRCGALDAQFHAAHKNWRAQRNLEPLTGYPTLRYVLLHSLSHALIRQFSVECGYAAASLHERIYSAPPESGEPMAGILIYTAAPDSEGTLGGLVSLGETGTLERHLQQALESLSICAADPLCAETQPQQVTLALHGSACHNCMFLPETSCERGNRYLDRSALVPTIERDVFAFFNPL